MNDLNEGDERPTLYLQFFDGVLHQQWEIGYRDDDRMSAVGIKTVWRKVPSTVTSRNRETP